MTIRIATFQDIPAIQHIAEKTWPATYGSILSQEQFDYMMDMMYSTESLAEQMNNGHQFYVAELDGTTFGFASVSKEANGVFKLNKLYVIPTTQKTGEGKALLQTTIDYAKQNGGKQLQLQVNRYNNAKNFYEKMGFVIIEEKDFHIGKGYYMNDYVMSLSLK
jgi:N-acetylglutamate synthase-like GNAT family acetyltransferase